MNPLPLPPNLFLLDPANKEIIGTDSRRLLFNRTSVTAVLAVLMVAVLLLILWQGVGRLPNEVQLAGTSATASGEIIDHRSAATGGNGQAIVYFVTYHFSAGPENRTYTGNQLVNKATFDRLAPGARINVKYVSTDPTISELAGSSGDNTLRNGSSLMLWLGLFGTLVTGGFAILRVQRLREEWRLRRSGRLLIGHINHCVGKLKMADRSATADHYGAGLRGKYLIEIYYRFRTPEDHEIRKRAVLRRNDLLGAVLPGPDTPIAVLYLDSRHYKAL